MKTEDSNAKRLGRLFLWAALSLFAVSCSTEETFQTDSAEAGFHLAGKGMEITADKVQTSSRLSASGWTEGDRLGVAWVATNQDITSPQLPALQNNAAWGQSGYMQQSDSKLYQNHKFECAGGRLTSEGDIYEGAYFAYFPFAKQQNISNKTIVLSEVQDKQDGVAKPYYFAHTVYLSPLDSIVAKKNADETIKKTFALKAMTNALTVSTIWADDSQTLADKLISGVEIVLPTDNRVFSTKASLHPQNLPTAVYANGCYDAQKSLEKMDEKLFGTSSVHVFEIEEGNYSSTLANTLTKEAVVSACKSNNITLFTFPTRKPEVALTAQDLEIHIFTSKLENNELKSDGYFSIKLDMNDTYRNNAMLEKLADLLNGDYQKQDKHYSLQKLTEASISLPTNLSAGIYKSGVPTDNQSSWDAAVDEINQLGLVKATIRLKDDAVVSKFPTKAELTVLNDNDYKITIQGAPLQRKAVDLGTTDVVVPTGSDWSVAKDATVTAGSIQIEGMMHVDAAMNATIKICKDSAIHGELYLQEDGKLNGSVINQNRLILIPSETTLRLQGSITQSEDAQIMVTFGEATTDCINNTLSLTNKSLDVTFNGTTLNNITALSVNDSYASDGNTSIGVVNPTTTNWVIKSGSLTFMKEGRAKLGEIYMNKGIKLIVETGDKSANDKVVLSSISGTSANECAVQIKDKSTLVVTGNVNGVAMNVEEGSIYKREE